MATATMFSTGSKKKVVLAKPPQIRVPRRAGHRMYAVGQAHADGQAPTVSGKGFGRVKTVAKGNRPLGRPQCIGAHFRHGPGPENAFPVQLAAVQDHLTETEIVRHRRNRGRRRRRKRCPVPYRNWRAGRRGAPGRRCRRARTPWPGGHWIPGGPNTPCPSCPGARTNDVQGNRLRSVPDTASARAPSTSE